MLDWRPLPGDSIPATITRPANRRLNTLRQGRIHVDRRHFVAGSAAAAAALTIRPILRAGRLSVPRHHLHQSVSARRRRRRRRPAARRRARADRQAAVRDRDQGRRRRRRSARRSPPMPSRTATRCCCTSPRSPALPRSTSCSAATPKFTRADFIPIARLTAGPMVLVVNDQQPYKTLKELVDDAKKRPDKIIFSSSGLYGALHLPTALFMKAAGDQDAASADQWRRAGADGDPRQQLAGAGVVDRRRQRARSRPASCARSPASAPSARRRCPTCRP